MSGARRAARRVAPLVVLGAVALGACVYSWPSPHETAGSGGGSSSPPASTGSGASGGGAPAPGAALALHVAPASDGLYVDGFASDANGHAYFAGVFSGTLTLPNKKTFTSPSETIGDPYALSLGPGGEVVWSVVCRLDTPASDALDAGFYGGIAPTTQPPGGAIIAGGFKADLTCQQGTADEVAISHGAGDDEYDTMLLAVDETGTVIAHKTYGGPGKQLPHAVAATLASRPGFSGELTGTLDAGASWDPLVNSEGSDVFVVSPEGPAPFDAAIGNPNFDNNVSFALAFDDDDDALVGGSLHGPIQLADASTDGGVNNGFVAHVVSAPPDGVHAHPGVVDWGQRFESDGDSVVTALAVVRGGGDSGRILAGGSFAGAITIAGERHPATGTRDGFVVALGPGGTHAFTRTFGGADSTIAITTIAGASDGAIVVAGTFVGELDVEHDQLSSTGIRSGFVMVLERGGSLRWARVLGGKSAKLSVDAHAGFGNEGAILVGGTFSGGALELGNGFDAPAPAANGVTLYLARLAP